MLTHRWEVTNVKWDVSVLRKKFTGGIFTMPGMQDRAAMTSAADVGAGRGVNC